MSHLRLFIRYGYAPLFLVGFVGVAIAMVAAGAPKGLLPVVLVVAIAVSSAAERVLPYEPAWNLDHRDSVTNLLHALANEASIIVSVLALPTIAAHVPTFELWPHHWPLGVQLAAAVVIADFGITLVHFISHHVGWLWRLHAVHHSAPRLYGFNGLMKHPLHQAIELGAGTAPILILGISSDVAWLLSFAVAIQLLLQHSNVDMEIGPLGYVWALAPAHRHHHIASAAKGDVNFGLFTAIWDHLLGTFVLTERPTPKAGEVGVDGAPNYPRSYGAHLVAPFRQTVPVLPESLDPVGE